MNAIELTAHFSIILFSSFFTFTILFFQGRNLGFKGSFFFILFSSFFQIGSLIVLFKTIIFNNNLIYTFNVGNWFCIGNLKVEFNFIFDSLSIIMIQLIIFISLTTQIYSFYYLKNDPNIIKFQSYISLFTFFMIVLVTADNFILFFTGWEGIGLCSYLLISFWSTRVEARMAGLKAIGINRFGDCAFIISISLIASIAKSIEFSTIFCIINFYKNIIIDFYFFTINYFTIINFFFFIAVSAKSAQIGLHIWLSDAMEGPTPVSALIHAATMVTAGIYLIIRISVIFEVTQNVKELLAFTGAITALFGASVAAFQWDIKKIIAYSTCSQLGYMLCACGFGGYTLAFYHLIIHGYFKALLFFAAGLVIHNFKGEQDIRKMGSLLKFLPLTWSYFFIGLTSLIGIPGTAGYYSKEKILDYISIIPSKNAQVCYSFLIIALIFTVIYSMRIITYVFTSSPRGPKPSYFNISKKNYKEAPFFIIFFLTFVSFLSIFADNFFHHFTIGTGSTFLNSAFPQIRPNQYIYLSEGYANYNRNVPIFTILFGFFFFKLSEAYKITFFSFKNFFKHTFFKTSVINKFFFIYEYWIFKFFQNGWFIDSALSKPFFIIFNNFINYSIIIEKGVCEVIGPSGVSAIFDWFTYWVEILNIQRSANANIALIVVFNIVIILSFI